MTKYREQDELTIKDEYQEIGWSLFDSSTIYKVTTTEFSIADGIISRKIWYANNDGTDYKAKAYKNYNNGFTTI